jgi:IMP dehydrogenase
MNEELVIDNLAEIVEELLELGHLHWVSDIGYSLSPEIKMPVSFGFENVAIQQSKNEVSSRLDVDIESEFCRGVVLTKPFVAANMSTVVNADFCIALRNLGALGVLHRAYPTETEYLKETTKIAQACGIVAVSVGIGQSQVQLATKLYRSGADIIVIDVAHGYSNSVKQTAIEIKRNCPAVKLVIGNTTNIEALTEYDGIADAIKVGIANGLACETKNTAGCNEKQFSSILKFKERAKKLGMPIIGDGGIREAGDAVKAIAAGASTVMMGSVFARCPESAGPVIEGKKLYAGMASRYVQDLWKGGLKEGTCAEGRVVMLDLGESVSKLLERYSGALKSGITYAGARDVKSFHDKVKFVRV